MGNQTDRVLSPRYERALGILIEEHIRTGMPVGSRTISKYLGVGFSAATVRNMMQDMEEMALVRQPHTSAGRVPTPAALKYYITHMMQPKRLGVAEKRAIEHVFLDEFADILHLLDGVGKILANLSNELGLIVAPAGEELILHRIEIIPITMTRFVMVLVTRSGLTRSIMMDIPDMPKRGLDMLKEGINGRLSGLKFSDIRKSIAERLADLEMLYGSFTTRLVESAEEIFRMEEEVAALFGRENILKKPEFSDPERLRQVMELSEGGSVLLECLPESFKKGVEVLVGPPQATQLGMVLASYRIGGGRGLLGIVGPTRMDYARLVELVSFAAEKMAAVWEQ